MAIFPTISLSRDTLTSTSTCITSNSPAHTPSSLGYLKIFCFHFKFCFLPQSVFFWLQSLSSTVNSVAFNIRLLHQLPTTCHLEILALPIFHHERARSVSIPDISFDFVRSRLFSADGRPLDEDSGWLKATTGLTFKSHSSPGSPRPQTEGWQHRLLEGYANGKGQFDISCCHAEPVTAAAQLPAGNAFSWPPVNLAMPTSLSSPPEYWH